MVDVRDGEMVLPFAHAVLARTLVVTGLEASQALDVAADVQGRLGSAPVDVQHVREVTAAVLAERGESEVLRRVRARWWLRSTRTPLVVAVGGTSGVGKSTASQGVANVLGIERVLSSDLVRAVQRRTLHPGLVPALSESSFSAQRMLRSNLEGDRLLEAFEQQASIVLHGSLAMLRRALKEGLQVVFNGVHIVPGLAEPPKDWAPTWLLLNYVLTVGDVAEHERRFTARFATSSRDPERYLSRLAAIRDLDGYIVAQARRAGVPVVESSTIDRTVADLLDLIAHDLEARVGPL